MKIRPDEVMLVKNRLTQVGVSFIPAAHRQRATMAVFQCECGARTIQRIQHVKNGHTKSCGCKRSDVCKSRMAGNRLGVKHGMSGSREYNSWSGMHTRVNCEGIPGYEYYGGRGIEVCERWRSFELFYADMGPAPEGCSIDRINNNGNYCPENCRWATRIEQQNNMSNNVILEIDGETKTLSQWATISGVNHSVIRHRIKRKMNPREAVFTPTRKRRKKNDPRNT